MLRFALPGAALLIGLVGLNGGAEAVTYDLTAGAKTETTSGGWISDTYESFLTLAAGTYNLNISWVPGNGGSQLADWSIDGPNGYSNGGYVGNGQTLFDQFVLPSSNAPYDIKLTTEAQAVGGTGAGSFTTATLSTPGPTAGAGLFGFAAVGAMWYFVAGSRRRTIFRG